MYSNNGPQQTCETSLEKHVKINGETSGDMIYLSSNSITQQHYSAECPVPVRIYKLLLGPDTYHKSLMNGATQTTHFHTWVIYQALTPCACHTAQSSILGDARADDPSVATAVASRVEAACACSCVCGDAESKAGAEVPHGPCAVTGSSGSETATSGSAAAAAAEANEGTWVAMDETCIKCEGFHCSGQY